MKRVLMLVAIVGVVAFASGAQPALAYDDGPSASIDPGQLVTYPTALAGLGDTLPTFDPTDVAIAGIPDTAVGIDSAPAVALPDPPPGTTLIVDDDHMQCPNATFMSINAAVAAAFPGYTIKVCPGIYGENVRVTKQLTFRGQTQASDGRCANPVTPNRGRPGTGRGRGLLQPGRLGNRRAEQHHPAQRQGRAPLQRRSDRVGRQDELHQGQQPAVRVQHADRPGHLPGH